MNSTILIVDDEPSSRETILAILDGMVNNVLNPQLPDTSNDPIIT